MKLLVISDAPIILKNGLKEAYAPYVTEMDLWIQHATATTFLCPTNYDKPLLTKPFKQQQTTIISVRRLEFNRFVSIFLSVCAIPVQIIILFNAMRSADHIHMRAPGNLTLLAGFVAMTLSRKCKTVKYAGNFSPTALQPLSYRLQKWLFSNRRLSKNTEVMVYGDWPNQSKNIIPFFTATYSEADKGNFTKTIALPLQFMFVGTLSQNKNPQLLVELVLALNKRGVAAHAHFYGDGQMMEELKVMSSEFRVQSSEFQKTEFTFHGNQPAAVVKKGYENCHFLFLASQSEGWPKVVAEAMWHGCIPIATPVSCVPWMLGIPNTQKVHTELMHIGSRGVLFENVQQTVDAIHYLVTNESMTESLSQKAQNWAQEYTLERFEAEIVKLLKS
jgi:glycosyltransferase involved in cell wall biosynthesis